MKLSRSERTTMGVRHQLWSSPTGHMCWCDVCGYSGAGTENQSTPEFFEFQAAVTLVRLTETT